MGINTKEGSQKNLKYEFSCSKKDDLYSCKCSSETKVNIFLHGKPFKDGEIPGYSFPGQGDHDKVFEPRDFSVLGRRFKILAIGDAIQIQLGAKSWILDIRYIPNGGDEEYAPVPLWAGDINGNGKLDLIMTWSAYETGGPVIFMDIENSPVKTKLDPAAHFD